MKFKVGDKVKVVTEPESDDEKSNHHFFTKGSIVIITEVYEDEEKYSTYCENKRFFQYLNDYDVEEVDKNE